MAKSGASFKPGERPIGRGRNVPNKRTVEVAEAARMQNDESRRRGLKLGKDMLEEYMMAFHAIAAIYQNKIAASMQARIDPAPADMAAFKEWGELVVGTAKNLADFQSPKFRAILVTAPADQPQLRNVTPGAKVHEINNPTAVARVYQQMMKQVG